MRTRSYLLNILIIVLSLNRVHAQPAQKPNIIFILADDIGYDVLTVNGGQSYSTSNLDSMARHGKSFTHCESSPMCSPTRMMLLTGKQNFRNYSTWGYLSDTAKTIGNLMRDAGYKTAFFGKLQLPLDTNSVKQMQNWGWNRFTVFEIMDDTIRNGLRYKSPNLVDNNGRVPDNITKDKYCDDILTTRILNFIDNNKTNPFFIYYSMSLCHKPFCPTPDDPQYPSWNPKNASNKSYFPSMVKYMDKKVGQILDKLRRVGLDNNTIVLFAGDNGTDGAITYYANGVKVKGGKSSTVERGTHVPLIAYMPGYIAPNSKNDDMIDFTDFFPTFAGLAHQNSLNKYGVLDGVSFYKRLFNKNTEPVRSYIFSHYAPYHGKNKDTLWRWVRNAGYKLYDSTGIEKDGQFFNVIKDPDEKLPLAARNFTPEEKALKATFRNILDTTPIWPVSPLIINARVSSITSNSAILSATLVNAGATALVERGSNLNFGENAFYYNNNRKDGIAELGSFSQKRTKLKPQTLYYYSLYGRNKNASHSLGYVFGTFYTLSSPPLKQPTTLTATTGACSIKLTWSNAAFPDSGATKGGYLLFYSAKNIVLNSNADGKPPSNVTTDPRTRVLNLQTTLPCLTATTIISSLSPDTLYHFTLVPYTYDGINSLTYNYLTNGALTITKRSTRCSASLIIAQHGEMNSSSAVAITPNPSRYNFILKMDKLFANGQVRIRVCDIAGRVFMDTKISGSGSYTFGSDLKPGVYIVYFMAGNKEYQFKIIKE